MKKRILIPLCAVISVALLLGFSYLLFNNEVVEADESLYEVIDLNKIDLQLEIYESKASFLKYENLTELENASEAILIGHPTKGFFDRTHINTYFDDGALQDYYTITDFKIERVIKSPKNKKFKKGDIVEIVEPIGIVPKGDGSHVLLTTEGYTYMEDDNLYIIFVTGNYIESYSVVSLELGKYLLDDNHPKDHDLFHKEHKHHHGDLDKLKNNIFKQILDKYDLKYSH